MDMNSSKTWILFLSSPDLARCAWRARLRRPFLSVSLVRQRQCRVTSLTGVYVTRRANIRAVPHVAHLPRPPRPAYAGLDFIKAAFCPLEFNAKLLKDHPSYLQLRCDMALADLEVSEHLQYPRKFGYTDPHGHRKTGIQMVTAPFGLAPADFDLFLGMYSYLKRLPELPGDGQLHMTADFLAKQVGLPATCAKDYQRIRSRVFRFSYVKYTNSAFWNPQTRTYDIVNFGFYNLASLSRVTESRRPIVFEFDPTFLRLIGASAFLAFDYELYRSFSPAMRRFYLIANRDGWNQQHSSLFVADDFAIHQIGYAETKALSRLRLQKLKRLLASAEDLDIIRPFEPWKGYFQPMSRGLHRDKLALRWTRGPRLKRKEAGARKIGAGDLENDPLFAQVRELRDEVGQSLSPLVYQKLLAEHGAKKVQRHVAVVLAQREYHPGSFSRSEVAAFVDRVQHDRPEPDWYQVLARAERLSPFAETQPNQLSLGLYKDLFQ